MKITHLLDPPSTHTFSAVPYLTEESDGAGYGVHGYNDMIGRVVYDYDIEGVSLALPEPIEVEGRLPFRLGWLGKAFLSAAEELQIVPEVFEARDSESSQGGSWSFLEHDLEGRQGWIWVAFVDLPKIMDDWILRVGAGVFMGDYGRREAYLMKRCKPDHEVTRIAVWLSLRHDRQEQKRELDWTIRIFKDNKEELPGDGTRESLEAYYRRRVGEWMPASPWA